MIKLKIKKKMIIRIFNLFYKKINNKIKKLTEEDKKLNKANEELKQNF